MLPIALPSKANDCSFLLSSFVSSEPAECGLPNFSNQLPSLSGISDDGGGSSIVRHFPRSDGCPCPAQADCFIPPYKNSRLAHLLNQAIGGHFRPAIHLAGQVTGPFGGTNASSILRNPLIGFQCSGLFAWVSRARSVCFMEANFFIQQWFEYCLMVTYLSPQ